MDSSGMSKANNIISRINDVPFNYGECAEKILDEENLILDETGMLAIKTKEGLKEISESVMELLNKKNKLCNTVSQEGNQLRQNYLDYQEYLRKKELEASDVTTEVVTTTSHILPTGVKGRDIVQRNLE